MISINHYKRCDLCPRECKADRTNSVGFCGMSDKIVAAKAMVHYGEEPCISGTGGSGAVFFTGCILGCKFCQNHKISQGKFGKEISIDRLSEIYISLQEKNVHNINLVSATQFTPSVLMSLERAKDKLNIPVVWNTGGYEKTSVIDEISKYCDIFLQDIKFFDPQISNNYAKCKDYFKYAIKATEEMVNIVGEPIFDEEGIMKKGVIVRHLVLPSNRKDSISVLSALKSSVGTDKVVLSLMSQYTPPSFKLDYKELNRRLTTFEYKSVCEHAFELGFLGYFQDMESAQSTYTPIFDLSGL